MKVKFSFEHFFVIDGDFDVPFHEYSIGGNNLIIYTCPTHATPLLHDLHWLRVPERILLYKCTVVSMELLRRTLLMKIAVWLKHDSRCVQRRIRRWSFPNTVHSSIGDLSFPVAAARVWNILPQLVTSSPSLIVFRRRLNTEPFARSLHID